MKNNLIIINLILLFNFILIQNSVSYDQFNFDVTEVEIKEDGNRFIGKKRGTATSSDKGMLINADEFDYDKIKNILKVNGNLEFIDSQNKIKIYSDSGTYLKQEEKIFTEGNSKGIDQYGTIITAHSFNYDKIKNILKVNVNLEFIDSQNKIKMYSDSGTYLKQEEKIFTEGNSKGLDQDGTIITDTRFNYDKIKNIIKVNGNLEFIDYQNKIKIYSDNGTYLKQEEKILNEENSKCL